MNNIPISLLFPEQQQLLKVKLSFADIDDENVC